MHKIALKLGWSQNKGPMISCKACSVRKAKKLAINKHVDDSKKATRAGRRKFSYLGMMKASQEVGITVTKIGTLSWICWSFTVPRVLLWNHVQET